MKDELLLVPEKSQWCSDTHNGNLVWHLMFSLMPKIKKDLKKADSSVSTLGRLLGILLYATQNEGWIADNEVYEDERKFSKWFSDYSQAWKEILKRSDQELGLALDGGRDGGYRSALVEMLRGWQRETNHLLDDLYNDEMAHGFNVKVDIVEASSEADIETESEKGSSGSKQAAEEGTSSGKSKSKANNEAEEEGKGKGRGKGKGKGKGLAK